MSDLNLSDYTRDGDLISPEGARRVAADLADVVELQTPDEAPNLKRLANRTRRFRGATDANAPHGGDAA